MNSRQQLVSRRQQVEQAFLFKSPLRQRSDNQRQRVTTVRAFSSPFFFRLLYAGSARVNGRDSRPGTLRDVTKPLVLQASRNGPAAQSGSACVTQVV